MTNNDVLRRVRYIFDFSDDKMIALFAKAGCEVSREQVSDWLKKDEDEAFVACPDQSLACFLNGLIIDRRGRKEGPLPTPETQLNRNIILRKLKIALDLKADGILELLSRNGMHISNHELSALFRKPGHKHYRVCKEQLLRNFLTGLQLKYRDDLETPDS